MPTQTRTFGEILRTARKNAQLTQKELGEKIGVVQSAVSSWERGAARPDTVDAIVGIADLLGLSVEELTRAASAFAQPPEK